MKNIGILLAVVAIVLAYIFYKNSQNQLTQIQNKLVQQEASNNNATGLTARLPVNTPVVPLTAQSVPQPIIRPTPPSAPVNLSTLLVQPNNNLAIGTSAAGVGASILALSPATGPAAPFVAAAAGLVALFSKLFGGCGNSCIDASKINQVFYAILQNLNSLNIQNMLPDSAEIPILQYLESQAASAFPGDIHGVNGYNLTLQTLDAAIAFRQSHLLDGDFGGTTLPQNLHDYYIRGSNYAGLQPQWKAGFALAPSQGGSWYSDSLDQADNFTDALLYHFGYGPGIIVPGYNNNPTPPPAPQAVTAQTPIPALVDGSSSCGPRPVQSDYLNDYDRVDNVAYQADFTAWLHCTQGS